MNTFNRQLLALFSFICLLILARIAYTSTLTRVFLIWNIFLAWIPFALSPYLTQNYSRYKWQQALLFGVWLLFYPNALYLVTDLVHIPEVNGGLLWLDIILLFCTAALGLCLAFQSLTQVEKYLSGILPQKQLTFAVALVILVSSYGVCLGRFGRWNSWDVVSSPVALVRSIIASVVNPVAHLDTWCITALFSAFFYLIYYFSKLNTVEIKNAG